MSGIYFPLVARWLHGVEPKPATGTTMPTTTTTSSIVVEKPTPDPSDLKRETE
jgi:hypothetical protein